MIGACSAHEGDEKYAQNVGWYAFLKPKKKTNKYLSAIIRLIISSVTGKAF
jgi:hypothetical protein